MSTYDKVKEVIIDKLGVDEDSIASFHAIAVSTKSAGLQLSKLGVDLKVTRCSIG